jgi:hypothetical protein
MTVAQIGIKGNNAVIPYVATTKATKQVALTVTGTNWTTIRAIGVAYADSAGAWRLKFNIKGSLSSAASVFQGTVTGVVFKSVGAEAQAQAISVKLTEYGAADMVATENFVGTGTSIFQVSAAANFNRILVSGDVELNAEPTWASANMEGVIAADVYIANYIPGTSPGLVPSTGLPPGETYTNTAASGAGAVTIDFSTSVLQRLVLTGNCALTLTAAALPETCILMLVQDGTGTRIPTWTTTVKWAGGTAPTLSTAINSVDIITFARINSVWYGMFNLDFK